MLCLFIICTTDDIEIDIRSTFTHYSQRVFICAYRDPSVFSKMPPRHTRADLPVKDLFIVTTGPYNSYSVESMLAMVPYIKNGGQGWIRTNAVYLGSFPLCRRVHSTALLPGHVISNIVAANWFIPQAYH